MLTTLQMIFQAVQLQFGTISDLVSLGSRFQILIIIYPIVVGCLLICISLIHFITSGSYNYAHISAERKNAEIREILSSELYNFDSINDRNYMTDRNTSLQKIGNMKHVAKNTKGSILPGDLRNPKLMAFRRNSYQNSIWQ